MDLFHADAFEELSLADTLDDWLTLMATGGDQLLDLAVLCQIFRPNARPELLCEEFDLFGMPEYFVRKYMRFRNAHDVMTMCDLLQMPAEMQAANGTKTSGLEVLCIVLRRLAYPCRFADLCAIFPRNEPELCLLFNLGIHHIYDNFHHKLTAFNQPWVAAPELLRYCQAIARKGAPLQNCWGFIDGTVRPMCRPGQHQREVFNGHKRVHGLKFQSIVIPNGLIANLHGPIEGRRHDSALLTASGAMQYMEANCNIDGAPLCVYGDPAYPLRPHLHRPHRGNNLTREQQQFNTDMSSVRQAVEWGFQKITTEWAFLDFKKNLKLFLSPVGKLYMVGALLANCHTCMYGSEVASYFELNPPSVEDCMR
ncbi:uncharacterized protein [Littorina saxatilis]|uniref:uncharacterized protein n=1 Tax=Littorina saxatilis TaxID=31220 RepID=UPI0038B5B71F